MKNINFVSGRAVNIFRITFLVVLLAPSLMAGAQGPFMQYPDIQGEHHRVHQRR